MAWSELIFLADLVRPVAFAALIVASLVLIVWSARKHRATPVASGLPGLVPALTAGTLVSAPLVFLSVLLGSYSSPDRTSLEIALSTFVLFAGPVVLSVLDVYAIWPPVRRTHAGAIGRAALGVVLATALSTFITDIHSTVSAAASDAFLAEHRAAIVARSEGLSIEVAVVGAKLGAVNENGRLVDDITIDITVRSADEIQLREARPDQFSPNQDTWIRVVDSVGYQLPEGLHLPTLIPAGFDKTYRVTARLSSDESAEYYVAGPWEASVSLYGPLDETTNLTIDYSVTTTFTVSDTP